MGAVTKSGIAPADISAQRIDSPIIKKLLDTRAARMKVCLSACASCSLCAESCFLYMSHDRDPEYMPSYKVVRSLGVLYKKKGRVSRKQLERMQTLVWRNCVLCGRCYCPIGIDIPGMIAFARRLLRTQGIYGVYPYTTGAPEADYASGESEE